MTYRLVETVSRFTPLGVRFWDAASCRQVRNGLRVTAWPLGATGEGVRAIRTVSGVYAFFGLPGLGEVERGQAPTAGPDVLPLQRRFVVAVEDVSGRFVPVAFLVDLPREERGVYPPVGADSLPDEPLPGFLLFSAPERPVPPGAAVVRAQLEDAITGKPATHAILEVAVDGETWLGLADDSGAVAVYFPVPPFRHDLGNSFPEGALPLHQHTWSLTVRLRYAPGAILWAPEARRPLLGSLSDQAPGRLHAESPNSLTFGEPTCTLTTTLVYGRETVLRSRGSSTLLVDPAPSFP